MPVLNSTRGFCDHARGAAISRMNRAVRRCIFGSSGTLVDDAPAPVLVDPVLALLHGVRQVARAVLLIETYEHEVFLARIAEHADVAHLHLDPALAAVDQSL